MTILLLEDEPTILNLLRAIFSRHATIVEATCEQTAASLGMMQHIDLMIAAVAEPCRGIHAAFRLREVHPRLRIILTSGLPTDFWNEQQWAELSELPSDSVRLLRKPFVPATVREMVDELLGPAGTLRTSAARA